MLVRDSFRQGIRRQKAGHALAYIAISHVTRCTCRSAAQHANGLEHPQRDQTYGDNANDDSDDMIQNENQLPPLIKQGTVSTELHRKQKPAPIKLKGKKKTQKKTALLKANRPLHHRAATRLPITKAERCPFKFTFRWDFQE
jgi:hypothetical protein